MAKNKIKGTHSSKTLKQKIACFANAWLFQGRRFKVASIALVAVLLVGGVTLRVGAESYPGGTDNGLTSNLLSLFNTLTTDGYGTTTNTPNWGSDWNRIATAAEWTPSANSTASDVISGDTYYGNSRTQSTGTYPAPSSCATEAYQDNYGAPVTQTTNCTASVAWTVPSGSPTGSDHYDPRTGLLWSEDLINNSGTLAFTTAAGSSWTWNNSGTANVAVGNLTATQLCTTMGGSWRLPTQKELMQAYIDGANFNLGNPSNYFWSGTQSNSTNAWLVNLSSGYTNTSADTSTLNVRCVN